MASGIKVTDECYKAYSDLKTKAKRDDGKKQPRCIIFKINDTKTEVVIDKIIERGDDEHQEEEFRHIVENLPAKDGRYLLIDLWVPSGGQTENEKLLFVTWSVFMLFSPMFIVSKFVNKSKDFHRMLVTFNLNLVDIS